MGDVPSLLFIAARPSGAACLPRSSEMAGSLGRIFGKCCKWEAAFVVRRVPVADMITHRLPLEETPKGFRLMSTPGGEHLKVVIVP